MVENPGVVRLEPEMTKINLRPDFNFSTLSSSHAFDTSQFFRQVSYYDAIGESSR